MSSTYQEFPPSTRVSPASRWGRRSPMVLSTAAAGTIIQTTLGFGRFIARSWSEEAPVAFSRTSSSTAFGDMSNATHRCPALRSRRTMFAPILPRPIIPSCIGDPPLRAYVPSMGFPQLARDSAICAFHPPVAADQGIRGAVVPQDGLFPALQLRDDALRQRL